MKNLYPYRTQSRIAKLAAPLARLVVVAAVVVEFVALVVRAIRWIKARRNRL